ncbi:hypothetical protein LMG28138_03879 [Pararobbsia alpina]|uniref:Uncharacterized protein n=1 Tax=Pararobbsia alpina TaxID=621374 RepID=A0A6S7CQP1_9BURK|nr:hypothetical protein LMG28138_03879 [Pararobbsia alpina]
MGIFSHASSVAESASGTNIITSAAVSVASFQFSTIVSAAGFVLTLVYLWGALPRFWRVTVAVKRGLFNKDWSLWRKLGNQPTPMKED